MFLSRGRTMFNEMMGRNLLTSDEFEIVVTKKEGFESTQNYLFLSKPSQFRKST